MSFMGQRGFLVKPPTETLLSGGTVTGNLVVTGTVNTGAATLASVAVTGAATVGTTLGVTGTTTLAALNAGATTTTTLAPSDNLTMASGKQILADAGTAAAPGYAFAGAASTGLSAASGNPLLSRAGSSGITYSASAVAVTPVLTSANDTSLSRAVRVLAASVKTANYQVTSADAVVIMNGTTLTATLPATPATSQMLWIRNLDAATNVTVARNGNTIDGAAADGVVLPSTGQLYHYNGTGWHRLI